VALIEKGVPRIRRETTVGDLTVKVPSVDVRTVGAGGGSLAHVPSVTKALRVGPESAGAVPGPAAYSKGGTQATVTDANAVLGYLPEYLLGGSFKLDIPAARKAVQKVADDLGVSLFEAAEGILRIANETM
jgi:5-oxoprolinase (ATP-hydrolysing)